ncbi:hypothetical protein P9279_30665, partial [Mesorhizobium sp. WSM4962]|uniref:hypothetical protein n=1 Tax=Mesorhizobium sp. WSM4962 TaxID=3038548 RepID=UPI00241684B3
VVAKGERVNVLLDKIEAAQVRAEKLADQYKSVNLSGGDSPLVMNKLTYKYHTPEASASIDSVKQMSLGPLDNPAEWA